MNGGTILRLLLVCAYGIPIARALDRKLRGAALFGAGFLVGCGFVALDLFFLSVFRIPWTRTSIVLGALPALVTGVVLASRRPSEGRRGGGTAPHWLDAVIAIPIIGHAFFATWTRMFEWDYLGIWGLKGRTFFESRGIDWNWVKTNIAHPDYAPLVPLMYDFTAVTGGHWDERSLGLIYTAMCAALILVMRTELGPLATLAIVFPALNLWVGLAEAAVMAFGCAGLVFVRRGDLTLGAVLLGFAAWSKNEGLALLACAVVALVVSRRWRDAIRLWPALLVFSPWLIARMVLRLQTDFTDRYMFARIWGRIIHPAETVRAFADAPPDQPWFWVAVLLCIVIYARIAFTRERFLTTALLLQMLAFLAQGIATRASFGPHVSLTMNRLPQQIAPAFAFLAVVLLFANREPADGRAAIP